jgi:hypothetical protein
MNEQVWDGAVQILAATKGVPLQYRLKAFAIACDALFKTDFTLEVERS